MALSPGTRVGPYEVVSLLGAGGMGEVFRARDARLKRDVALKVLPPAAVGDAQKRSRFDREAQVLASLNHPSIAQVFGVEMDGDTPVIVMELVEGATLAERLARGAMPFDEALPIATQICDGLEAAHERNIIHRDLKPANIKVRPDGTIKILDFGIARVLTNDTAVDTSNSPTILGGSTDAGIILGTAAYMSPEQARGRAVDKRADIWAFGCILYELLSGEAVFAGESTTDILAEVVTKEPDWTRVPASTPERLVELMKRCLQKSPKDRLRDVADAKFEIEQASRPAAASRAATPSASAASHSGSLLPSIGWFVAGAAVAAAVVTMMMSGPVDTAPPLPVSTTINLPPGTTLALGRGSSVALSPDGHTLVFAGKAGGLTQLYIRPLDRYDAQPLPGTDGATNPFFSPDGRWVGFFSGEKLKKVSLDGGTPVAIADALNARGEVWGANDEIFVTPANSAPVSRLPARGGGKLEPFTTLRVGELSHRWPRQLPDGKTLLFSIWNDAGWEASRIAAVRAAGGDQIPVVEVGGGYPYYIRDEGRRGFLVYARSEGLLAARFDESTLAITGQAVPIVDGVITNLSGGAHFDLSPSGSLAYAPGEFGESGRELSWVTRDGKASPSVTVKGLTRTWRLSPDGTRVVRNSSGSGDVWVEDLVSHQPTRITHSNDGNFNGVWSGDGKFIVFARGLGATSLFLRPSDGRDVEQRVTTSARAQSPTSVSMDGRWLAFFEADAVTNSDIWVVQLPGSGAAGSPRPFVNTKANEGYGAFSPDTRWMAYQSNESGRFEVYVRPFPEGQQAFRVSTDGGVSPVWSASGTELFYRSSSGKVMAVDVRPGTVFSAGQPHVLFDALNYENTFAVSPDGQRFLMMPLIATELNATQINLVVNFLTELRQRVR